MSCGESVQLYVLVQDEPFHFLPHSTPGRPTVANNSLGPMSGIGKSMVGRFGMIRTGWEAKLIQIQ